MLHFIWVCAIIITIAGIGSYIIDWYDNLQRTRRFSRIDFLRKHPNYYEGEDGKIYKRQ